MADAKKSKKRADDPIERAMTLLVDALDAKNEFSNPGVEVARVDAAELVLKHAAPGEKDAVDAALDFLVRAVDGQVISLNAPLRTRAAGILIRHKRGTL